MSQPPWSKKIRVLLVDDSPLALVSLKRALATSGDIEVVGTARDGKEAIDLVPSLKPTVICADLHMPVMDGLQFTKEVMTRHPTPILAVSASVEEGSRNVFRLLEAGAVDVCPKPRGVTDSQSSEFSHELVQKIKILSGVKVFRRASAVTTEAVQPRSLRVTPSAFVESNLRVVVIGASTGGPQALQTILTKLPADFKAPVVCIQHISEGFLQGLVEWLTSMCRVKILIARAGDLLLPGTVYFAPEGVHLKFDNRGRFSTSMEPAVNGHRPSVTVTMKSAAEYYGSGVVGVLLTGMGNDGAAGMLAIVEAGGLTVAQDEGSSIVFGMPKVAIEMGAASYVAPLDKIADTLINRFRVLRPNG